MNHEDILARAGFIAERQTFWPYSRSLKNGNLLRQRKNPDRLCMPNTLRALDYFASLHFAIFERPASFEFFNSQIEDARGQHKNIGGNYCSVSSILRGRARSRATPTW
jgi:hypothetical protein